MPLTADRAKPAVPFGGGYRLIDFVLSNLVNGGIDRIAVLTQYKSHSLDRHISLTWRMSNILGQYVTPVPAQQRLGLVPVAQCIACEQPSIPTDSAIRARCFQRPEPAWSRAP